MADQFREMGIQSGPLPENLRMDCQNATTNLDFTKTLQWNITYYAVLLYGAIIALTFRFGSNSIASNALVLVTNALFHIALYLTLYIQYQIRRERISLNYIRQKLTPVCQTDKGNLSEKEKAKRLFRHPLFTITVISTVVAGYVCAMAIIFYEFKT